jgi:hypothetical protein
MLTANQHDIARITGESRAAVLACSGLLENEFSMADEAFALSPISARAAQPDESDYEAIREAFMETARGRWFLGEYAKRNRNADTSMVLDAVARIEQTLEALQQPTADSQLAEVLTTICDIVDQAAEVAVSAADGLAIEDRLAPIHRGARILKEISWRWREIGAESRICDSIESQVEAIQQSCSQLARVDTRTAFTVAFELMRTRIEALARENGLVPPAAKAAAKFCPAGSETVVVEPIEPASAGSPAAPASEPHPSLGSTPFAADSQEPRRPPDIDPITAIRRMSLIEKYAFFE